MDYSTILFLLILIPFLFVIRYYFETRLKHNNTFDESYKLRVHIITNRIDRIECWCTPECLKQTKDMRLESLLPLRILPRITRERVGIIRPFQFISESSP